MNVFDEPWEEEEEEDEDIEELWAESMDEENLAQNTRTAHHVPIDNDDFVERANKIRKKKSTKTRMGGTQAKRLRLLEDGLMGLQSQIQQIAHVISRQAPPLNEPQHNTPITAALKGAIPWPEGLILPDRVHPRAKGDGNCLWHSVAATLDNNEGRPVGDDGGMSLKRETLDHLRGNPTQWAAVWQCQENGILGAATEWETQWADARACLTLSKLRDMTIIIFNRRDQLIETISAGQTPPFRGRVVVLDYSGDHYDPLPSINPSDLQKIASATALSPWRDEPKSRREGGFVLREGRCSLIPGRTSPMNKLRRLRWKGSKKNDGRPVEPVPTLQERDGMSISTWNVGGLRANLLRVTAYLKQDNPDMVLIQESRVAKEHQRGIRAQLKALGYDTHFECATPWKRNARGQTRLDIGRVPGVMCIVKDTITVMPVPPMTHGADEIIKKGRLQFLHLHSHGQDPWLITNMYFPAGKIAAQDRHKMSQAIFTELEKRGTDRVLLEGDWNQHPFEAELAQKLMTQRLWTIPTLVEMHNNMQDATYVMDGRATWIDSFMVGSATQCQIPVQVVDSEVGTLHRRVSIFLPCEPKTRIPTLKHPPTLEKKQDETCHDWGATTRKVRSEIGKAYEEPTRERIDCLWDVWTGEYHHFVCSKMTSQRDPTLGDMGACGIAHRKPGRMPGVSRPTMTSIETCVQAIDRMRQNQPLTGKALTRQLDAVECLKEQLDLEDSQIQDMLERPGTLYQDWKQRLDRVIEGVRREGYRAWKTTLTQGGRPHRALYRWLKGEPVRVPLGLQEGPHVRAGPGPFFKAARAYWHNIMCRDPPRDTTRLEEYIENCQYSIVRDPKERVELLGLALKHLKKHAAGGMDMWPVQAIQLLPSEQLHLLCDVYDVFVHAAQWPSALLTVRTQLVPKRSAEAGLLEVGEWRPLAISSAWVRAWAKWQLLQQNYLIEQLDASLVGGVPGRCAVARMVEILLELEEAEASQEDFHLLSLDAVKCFDKVDICHALGVGEALGMTKEALRGHAALLRDHQRVFTANSFVDQVVWHPTNGLLQGDPLSVVLCVACVHQWVQQVAPSGARVCAYVDDRTMYAKGRGQLQEAWKRSQEWDALHGWEVNYKKTKYMASGGGCAFLPTPTGALAPVDRMCLLGYDILSKGCFTPSRMRERALEVRKASERMARAPLPPWVMQQVVAVVLLPKLSFGPQVRRMLASDISAIRACVKRALHVEFRAHSWHMLMLCVFPVHRVDPQNFIMYMHVMNIVRAVQDKEQVQVAWEEAYNARRHRQGLCTTYLHYMRALQLEVEGEPFAWRVGEENMDIRHTARHKLGHALRERMRQQALQEAARRRTHLAGAEGACCDTLKKCVGKHEGVLRSEILMVLCDGIWTQSKKYKAGLIPTPKCVWCGEYEDIEHIVYRCTRWRTQRDMFRDDIPMLLDGPPCRKIVSYPGC